MTSNVVNVGYRKFVHLSIKYSHVIFSQSEAKATANAQSGLTLPWNTCINNAHMNEFKVQQHFCVLYITSLLFN